MRRTEAAVTAALLCYLPTSARAAALVAFPALAASLQRKVAAADEGVVPGGGGSAGSEKVTAALRAAAARAQGRVQRWRARQQEKRDTAMHKKPTLKGTALGFLSARFISRASADADAADARQRKRNDVGDDGGGGKSGGDITEIVPAAAAHAQMYGADSQHQKKPRSKMARAARRLQIFVSFVQVSAGVYNSLPVPWPDSVRNMFAMLSVFKVPLLVRSAPSISSVRLYSVTWSSVHIKNHVTQMERKHQSGTHTRARVHVHLHTFRRR